MQRTPLEKIFGENPFVGIRLTIQQGDEIIHQERKFDERWYTKIGSSSLAGMSEAGWQYTACTPL